MVSERRLEKAATARFREYIFIGIVMQVVGGLSAFGGLMIEEEPFGALLLIVGVLLIISGALYASIGAVAHGVFLALRSNEKAQQFEIDD